MRLLLLTFIILIGLNFTSAQTTDFKKQEPTVLIESISELIIYYPQYSTIDLVCGNMPDKDSKDVLFCCGASFTGELLK